MLAATLLALAVLATPASTHDLKLVGRAGSTVTLARPALPPDAREFEVLLALSGDGSPLRLTESSEATADSISVRLPNLPAASARIVFRYGDESSETEVPGPLVTVLVEPGSALTRVVFDGGEWWTEELRPSGSVPVGGVRAPALVEGLTDDAVPARSERPVRVLPAAANPDLSAFAAATPPNAPLPLAVRRTAHPLRI